MAYDLSKLSEPNRNALIGLVRTQGTSFFASMHYGLATSRNDWEPPALATLNECRRTMDLLQTWATGIHAVEMADGARREEFGEVVVAGIAADIRIQMADFPLESAAPDASAN